MIVIILKCIALLIANLVEPILGTPICLLLRELWWK